MTADEQIDEETRRAAYWVRWYAADRGMSLDKLAAFSDVGRNSVVELGKRAPNLRTLASVAAYLGVNVRDLLRDVPSEEPDLP